MRRPGTLSPAIERKEDGFPVGLGRDRSIPRSQDVLEGRVEGSHRPVEANRQSGGGSPRLTEGRRAPAPFVGELEKRSEALRQQQAP